MPVCVQCIVLIYPGILMTGVSQKLTYRMRKEISEKIDRLPMGYFDQDDTW